MIVERKKTEENIFSQFIKGVDNLANEAKIFLEKNLINERQMCYCNPNLKAENSCNKAIQWMKLRYKEQQFSDLKTIYLNQLKNKKCSESNRQQIEKDVLRTYPNSHFFKQRKVQDKLTRILQSFSIYDSQIGYVQGINYIAGALLYHAEEYMAFWILIIIFENIGVRDNYLPDMPGLYKHIYMIDLLIFNNFPRLFNHLCKHKITSIQFSTSWILSLFGSIIQLEDMIHFLDEFLYHGWKIFYQLFLTIIEELEPDLLENGLEGIFLILNEMNYNLQNDQIEWKSIIQKSKKVQIDNQSINDCWKAATIKKNQSKK